MGFLVKLQHQPRVQERRQITGRFSRALAGVARFSRLASARAISRSSYLLWHGLRRRDTFIHLNGRRNGT
jgi:hypothetical protein